CAWGGGFDVW
nr:immunoglobulin heavy chain junction region [Macaca mulatta]